VSTRRKSALKLELNSCCLLPALGSGAGFAIPKFRRTRCFRAPRPELWSFGNPLNSTKCLVRPLVRAGLCHSSGPISTRLT
jgi:hypothetical protein